jgi:hypothetical protein
MAYLTFDELDMNDTYLHTYTHTHTLHIRHGRLGIGETATNGGLAFDELDMNDTYIHTYTHTSFTFGHGRLGIGETITNGGLAFDELDMNDTYLHTHTHTLHIRHGRLGIGETATNGGLAFDELDMNDTYVPTPMRVDLRTTRIVSIAAGHKHTLACDEYGNCYSWGSARCVVCMCVHVCVSVCGC